MTEACSGWMDNKVKLGYWDRAEDYAEDILSVIPIGFSI